MEKRGLFGFLKTLKPTSDDQAQGINTSDAPIPFDYDQDVIEFAQTKLTEILHLAGFDGDISINDAQGTKLSLAINNCTDPGRIIGKDGATLHALQTLLRSMIHQQFNVSVKIVLDSAQYLQRRTESLRTQALKSAERLTKENRKRIALPSMNAAERREMHLLFEDDSSINTFSEGKGDHRRVVLVRANAS